MSIFFYYPCVLLSDAKNDNTNCTQIRQFQRMTLLDINSFWNTFHAASLDLLPNLATLKEISKKTSKLLH